MAQRSATAFFHQPVTHLRIDDIAQLSGPLTVFAGAGTAIDRTGLGWRGMIDGLLEPYVRSKRLRQHLLAVHDPLTAASIASQFYASRHEGDLWKRRIRDRIKLLLYAQGTWQGGRLATNVGRLLTVWAAEKAEAACLVTPNYDQYAEEALREGVLVRSQAGLSTPEVRRVFPDSTAPWLEKNIISCAYLHGFVPDERESDHLPIVSEQDYFDSAEETFEKLAALFCESNVIIVGAALTDPPLLRALLHSRKDAADRGFRRYALLPLQGEEWEKWREVPADDVQKLLRYSRKRLDHLGVVAIYPDFFVQVAQLLQEVLTAAASGPGSYSDPDSTIRYGKRLDEWWGAWAAGGTSTARQAAHYDLIADRLPTLQGLLSADDEPLKIECWLRWDPSANRRLHLWVSSVGTWSDPRTMRYGEIRADSDYSSIVAFCHGRPMVLDNPRPTQPGRWPRYMAAPVWWANPAGTGEVPVGVIGIGSMRTDGALDEDNRLALCQTLPELDNLASELVSPPVV